MEIRRRPPYPEVSVQSLTYKIKAPGAEPQNILEKNCLAKRKRGRQAAAATIPGGFAAGGVERPSHARFFGSFATE